MKTYEYKVIEFMDKNGCVDVKELTNVLNSFGLQGWHVVSSYTNELWKNAISYKGFGTNSTVDQNIIILEREIEVDQETLENIKRADEKKKNEEIQKKEKQQSDNDETVQEYVSTQLEKTDMADIRKLQDLYLGTSSLAFMRLIVPDAYTFADVESYKQELQKLKK